ncbi:protein of unknown function (plasmid) [Ralstonia solanacearum PSI07]|nr:protein of unknown function [Ralstonia solanacearum PSI07]
MAFLHHPGHKEQSQFRQRTHVQINHPQLGNGTSARKGTCLAKARVVHKNINIELSPPQFFNKAPGGIRLPKVRDDVCRAD